MSRVGKTVIKVPSGVKVAVNKNEFEAQGKLGRMTYSIPDVIRVECQQDTIVVHPNNEEQSTRCLWGTAQRNIANIVTGVDIGFKINLELSGVGYRAQVQGKTLILQLGYSHDINFPIPEGITIRCDKPTSIEVHGACKEVVGQVAAEIRKYRKPEPYKGKGVIREGEFVLRKEGKKK
jgi:large subunit ribosomal protein L6